MQGSALVSPSTVPSTEPHASNADLTTAQKERQHNSFAVRGAGHTDAAAWAAALAALAVLAALPTASLEASAAASADWEAAAALEAALATPAGMLLSMGHKRCGEPRARPSAHRSRCRVH